MFFRQEMVVISNDLKPTTKTNFEERICLSQELIMNRGEADSEGGHQFPARPSLTLQRLLQLPPIVSSSDQMII